MNKIFHFRILLCVTLVTGAAVESQAAGFAKQPSVTDPADCPCESDCTCKNGAPPDASAPETRHDDARLTGTIDENQPDTHPRSGLAGPINRMPVDETQVLSPDGKPIYVLPLPLQQPGERAIVGPDGAPAESVEDTAVESDEAEPLLDEAEPGPYWSVLPTRDAEGFATGSPAIFGILGRGGPTTTATDSGYNIPSGPGIFLLGSPFGFGRNSGSGGSGSGGGRGAGGGKADDDKTDDPTTAGGTTTGGGTTTDGGGNGPVELGTGPGNGSGGTAGVGPSDHCPTDIAANTSTPANTSQGQGRRNQAGNTPGDSANSRVPLPQVPPGIPSGRSYGNDTVMPDAPGGTPAGAPVVPEPGSLLLLAIGGAIGGVHYYRRRRRMDAESFAAE